MNKKRMIERLDNTFKKWLGSITDAKVRGLVRHNSIITGGSIVSMLLNEKVSDYDIYFRTKDTALAVARYYVDSFNNDPYYADHKNRFGYNHKALVLQGGTTEEVKQQIADQGERIWESAMLNIPEERIKIVVRSDGVADTDQEGRLDPEKIITDMDDIDYEAELKPSGDKKEIKPYHIKFLTSTSITLSNKIQLVIRFYGEPNEIHHNYDYLHCTNYWNSNTGKLILKSEALETILDKRLVYQGSLYPLSSIIRMRKFLNKGWKINAGQILKMCFQLSELNLNEPTVLEEQLIGVDTIYFGELIALMKKDSKDAGFKVDNHYVSTLVDKIFG